MLEVCDTYGLSFDIKGKDWKLTEWRLWCGIYVTSKKLFDITRYRIQQAKNENTSPHQPVKDSSLLAAAAFLNAVARPALKAPDVSLGEGCELVFGWQSLFPPYEHLTIELYTPTHVILVADLYHKGLWTQARFMGSASSIIQRLPTHSLPGYCNHGIPGKPRRQLPHLAGAQPAAVCHA